MKLPLNIGTIKRMFPLAGALPLAALLAILSGSAVLAQGLPPDGVTLVNQDDALVERKKEGDFIARPVFSHELDLLYYGIRHPDTGDWLTATFRVHGGEKRLSNGWQYTWEYPALDEQPELDPEEAFLLVMFVRETGESGPRTFHALVPVHQPRGLWDRVLGALDPVHRLLGDRGGALDHLRRGGACRGLPKLLEG